MTEIPLLKIRMRQILSSSCLSGNIKHISKGVFDEQSLKVVNHYGRPTAKALFQELQWTKLFNV